jgi:flagellar FliL protein
MSDAGSDAGQKKESADKAGTPGVAKILPVLMVLNLGGTGFVAWKTLTTHPASAAAHAAPGEPPPPGAAITGPVVAMEAFVVNLNEPGSSRFLKTSFDLEMTSSGAVGELSKAKRLVRDEVLRYLSGLTVDQTLGEDNKAKIRDEVQARADKLLGGGRVRRVFFTEFVVQ